MTAPYPHSSSPIALLSLFYRFSVRSKWVLLALVASLMGGTKSLAQNADSLHAIWNDGSKPDSVRFAALQGHASGFIHGGNPDSLLAISRQLIQFAEHRGMERQRGKAVNLVAIGFLNKGEQDSCIHYLEQAADIFRSLHDDRNLATVLNNLGNISGARGDLARAIEHHTSALRISESLKDSNLMARTLGNIGVDYHMQEDRVNAMDYYTRRMMIAEAIGQRQMLAEAYGNMAGIHLENGDTAMALSVYEKSLVQSRAVADTAMTSMALINMGRILTQGGRYDEAERRLSEGVYLAERIGDPVQQADGLAAIGSLYFARRDPGKALEHGLEALPIARDAGDLTVLSNVTDLLYKLFKTLGRDREALAMHEEYVLLRDSVLRDENKQAIMQQRFQYDYDKKEALLTAEQEKKDAVAAEELRRKNLQRNAFIGGFSLMVLLAGTFLFQRNRISKARKRSDELLLNILPAEVAEELKAKGSAEAVHIDQVTVLFTDFKGFTAMSEVLTPKELVRDLHECFSAFDHICEKHGLEKIKTIGDAYMAAGGLPTPNTTHATDVINAAFDMRDFIAEGKAYKIAAGLPYFEIRIGIHTGPVVAGIVGVKKFQYDIWGDTVNTASRMESSGEVGQVNISEATYALVQYARKGEDEHNAQYATRQHATRIAFTFTPRGKVQAKGKGEMEMYFVQHSTERV